MLRQVSLRIITMPIQSQGIITRDNVSVDVSAVAYYKVVELGSFIAGEKAAASLARPAAGPPAAPMPAPNGKLN